MFLQIAAQTKVGVIKDSDGFVNCAEVREPNFLFWQTLIRLTSSTSQR